MSAPGYIPIKASYYVKRRSNGYTSYVVRFERHRAISSKYTTKSFAVGEEHRRDKFICDWNTALEKNNSSNLAELSSLQRSEIQVALKKLDGTGVSILEAVEYFIKMKNPASTNMKISEAAEIFLNNLRARKVGKNYLEDQKHSFLKPFQNYFRNKKITEISRRDMQKYLLANKKWSDNNRIIHRRHLSAFFNNLIKDEVLSLNPTQGIILPEAVVEKKFYSPTVVWLFLHSCYLLKKWKTLAAHALVAFGGCRLREATRIKFEQIKGDGRIEVEVKQAKTRVRRILWSSDVLKDWLNLIPKEKRTGKICTEYSIEHDPANVKRFMRDEFGLAFDDIQNGFRQAFAAHFYANTKDTRTLAEIMGNSEGTIRKHYNGILKNENDGKTFFHLFPYESLVTGLDLALSRQLWKRRYSKGVDSSDLSVSILEDGMILKPIRSIRKWNKYNTYKSRYDSWGDPARFQRACAARITDEDEELFMEGIRFWQQFGYVATSYEKVSAVSQARDLIDYDSNGTIETLQTPQRQFVTRENGPFFQKI